MIEDSPARRQRYVGSLIALWTVNLATAALLAFVLLVFLPKMGAAFADFGTKLPAVTVLALRASQAPSLVVAVLALFVAVQYLGVSAWREGRAVVLLVGTVFLLVFVVAIAFAVFLPYVELVNSLSGA
jgi:type II secretory pathway component PulF